MSVGGLPGQRGQRHKLLTLLDRRSFEGIADLGANLRLLAGTVYIDFGRVRNHRHFAHVFRLFQIAPIPLSLDLFDSYHFYIRSSVQCRQDRHHDRFHAANRTAHPASACATKPYMSGTSQTGCGCRLRRLHPLLHPGAFPGHDEVEYVREDEELLVRHRLFARYGGVRLVLWNVHFLASRCCHLRRRCRMCRGFAEKREFFLCGPSQSTHVRRLLKDRQLLFAVGTLSTGREYSCGEIAAGQHLVQSHLERHCLRGVLCLLDVLRSDVQTSAQTAVRTVHFVVRPLLRYRGTAIVSGVEADFLWVDSVRVQVEVALPRLRLRFLHRSPPPHRHPQNVQGRADGVLDRETKGTLLRAPQVELGLNRLYPFTHSPTHFLHCSRM